MDESDLCILELALRDESKGDKKHEKTNGHP